MASILDAEHFHNEEAAYRFVEARVWPSGPVCPRCKGADRVGKLGGQSTRPGVYKCYACRKPFTVKVGTVFESSHIALRLWLQAIYLIASSKKGISANQLHRTLGVTLKTAWFIGHRIREAMREDGSFVFGSDGGPVEVDETFIGRDPHKTKPRGGFRHKQKVLSLIDRVHGRSRSMVIDNVTAKTIVPILKANIAREARVMTDSGGHYSKLFLHFYEHGMINHETGEYVSMVDPSIHTQTIESFFAVFKRGMKGVYQHCAHNHLNRYLSEFDFRYCYRVANGYSDTERADMLLKGIVGKRLTYKSAH